ncbi:TonB-dependent receptor [Bacteroides sp. 214]|uniref:SusC/RagA family TonB-linked outer membrane protein n=1 Tax=Bacteroides sp. 214 TaxID=2302935 RepID=UPI0013D82963|nr:TonB-dependent receptor [Bacteroides sp. 214]NDW12459.1 TonB-dependent receptor [Bacteroides sp. 214]
MKNKLFLWVLAFLLMIPVGMSAQGVTVKGNVVDSYGDPVIGASVVEKNKRDNGTITNLDGDFTLKIAGQKTTLIISYIGMVAQEVEATSAQNLKIVLKDDAQALDEVVIVGYGGSKARKDLTGSVGSISGAKLAQVPVASAAEALQGKIAGVQVTTVDGAPGAEVNIRIRGGGTNLTGDNSKPLFVVDGFIADGIDDIPPTDIQSIDVLKDASLAAVYGAKGGNGVVIVTTKSAQAGKIQVELNTYLQARKLAGKVDLLDTYEFVRYQMDYTIGSNSKVHQFRNDFGNPNDIDIYKHGKTHDWQDEVMGGTPLSQMYNVTVKGGNETLRFSTSLTHHDEKGIVAQSGVRRTNMNTKINIKLSPKLSLNINPRLTYRRDLGAGADGIGTVGLIGVLRYRPTNGLREYTYRDDKTLIYNTEKYWLLASPMDDINQNYRLKHAYTFTNQASLTWTPIEGLMFKTDIGQSWSFSDDNRYWDYLTSTGISNNDMGVAQITDTRVDKYMWTNVVSYEFDIKEKHNFSALLGHEVSNEDRTSKVNQARYFPQGTSARTAFANMGLGTPHYDSSTISTPIRMLSFFGQLNYNYNHKYLLGVTYRADGSTKFLPGKNQWGHFTSVSGAWTISEEDFMNGIDWISMMKIRLALGMSGNNSIGNDMYRYQYGVNSNGGPSWGETTKDGTMYYNPVTYPNSDIKWETTSTRNLALDLGFFKGRLTITPEVYWNTTKDLLYNNLIPTTTGFSSQIQNIGKVSNKGFDLTINGDIIQKKDFLLSANLTMGYNKRVVDKINGEDKELWTTSSRWKSTDNDFCLREGYEMGLIYGYVYDGLYGFDEFEREGFNYVAKEGTINSTIYGTAPGRPKFKDLSGPEGKPDGVIDDYDRTIIGNTNPMLQGGFGISGQWKNFDFNANFTYMLNFDLINATAYTLSSAVDSDQKAPKNVLKKFSYANRWVYHGDIYNTAADGSTYIYNLNEPLLSNSQHREYLDVYESINAGKTLWNPNDVTKKVTHSYFIEDGSFLRLQDITIGYTLPKKLTKAWGIERLRVYATGSNLFCWTNYSGFDPEVDIQTGLTPSVDYNRYPRSHGYLFGLNVTF